jgi:hypothetical protein
MSTMEPEEGGDATFALKPRHVDVQVHPIDTFEFEDHMFADDRGDAWS